MKHHLLLFLFISCVGLQGMERSNNQTNNLANQSLLKISGQKKLSERYKYTLTPSLISWVSLLEAIHAGNISINDDNKVLFKNFIDQQELQRDFNGVRGDLYSLFEKRDRFKNIPEWLKSLKSIDTKKEFGKIKNSSEDRCFFVELLEDKFITIFNTNCLHELSYDEHNKSVTQEYEVINKSLQLMLQGWFLCNKKIVNDSAKSLQEHKISPLYSRWRSIERKVDKIIDDGVRNYICHNNVWDEDEIWVSFLASLKQGTLKISDSNVVIGHFANPQIKVTREFDPLWKKLLLISCSKVEHPDLLKIMHCCVDGRVVFNWPDDIQHDIQDIGIKNYFARLCPHSPDEAVKIQEILVKEFFKRRYRDTIKSFDELKRIQQSVPKKFTKAFCKRNVDEAFIYINAMDSARDKIVDAWKAKDKEQFIEACNFSSISMPRSNFLELVNCWKVIFREQELLDMM